MTLERRCLITLNVVRGYLGTPCKKTTLSLGAVLSDEKVSDQVCSQYTERVSAQVQNTSPVQDDAGCDPIVHFPLASQHRLMVFESSLIGPIRVFPGNAQDHRSGEADQHSA